MFLPSQLLRRDREPPSPPRAPLSLPFELIAEIAHNFDRSELKCLRQVNYAWNVAIRPMVLDTLTISAAPLLLERGYRAPLKRICSDPEFSSMVKVLRVWVDIDEFPAMFNPVSLDAQEYGRQMGMETRWERWQRARRASAKEKAMKVFLKALLVAVPKLISLHRVELRWGDLDDMDAAPVLANAIVPYLVALPKLTCLVIESYSPLPSVLLSFQRLERLDVICASDLTSLSAIIANNPKLNALTLGCYNDNTMAPWKLGFPPPPPLDTLFPSSTSPVESLTISHFLLTELPHPFHGFQNLKSLRLFDGEPRNMSEAFWEGMAREGVRLERLDITFATMAMARYVASYSGLQWFSLDGAAYGGGSKSLWSVFRLALAKHVHVLKAVDIKLSGHFRLHYGPDNYDVNSLEVVGGQLCLISHLSTGGYRCQELGR